MDSASEPAKPAKAKPHLSQRNLTLAKLAKPKLFKTVASEQTSGCIQRETWAMGWDHRPRIPSPPPLCVAKTGRNNLNEEFTPLLPTGIGERF
jgi:hypothetical protein